jgi:transposase
MGIQKTLETRKNDWEERKESISRYDTSNLLPGWKKENPLLEAAYSQCLQNVTLRVDLAFRSFFRRVKAGEKLGYPRFKGFDRYDSFTFPQTGFKVLDDRIKLSKTGSLINCQAGNHRGGNLRDEAPDRHPRIAQHLRKTMAWPKIATKMNAERG